MQIKDLPKDLYPKTRRKYLRHSIKESLYYYLAFQLAFTFWFIADDKPFQVDLVFLLFQAVIVLAFVAARVWNYFSFDIDGLESEQIWLSKHLLVIAVANSGGVFYRSGDEYRNDEKIDFLRNATALDLQTAYERYTPFIIP
ncbi:MAG: hypothetical protein FJ167_03220 [Gammaproteobacteria bacterium]|nr:hypothetical protein [Gammaproteobacteria bacterium]